MTFSARLVLGIGTLALASSCKVSPSSRVGDSTTPQVPALTAPSFSSVGSAAPSPSSREAANPDSGASRTSSTSNEPCSHPSPDPKLRIVSPDGRVTVFVAVDASRSVSTSVEDLPHQDLCIEVSGQPPRVLVAGRTAGPNESVERTLAGFGDLLFSRDGALLFFTSAAWVTSTAAHAVELATGRESFLFDGAVEIEVAQGPDAGRFVASHFRLDDVYPVSSPKYRGRMVMWSLVTRAGKLLRKLTEAEAARLGADVP